QPALAVAHELEVAARDRLLVEDHVVLGRLADADDLAGEDLLAPRRPAAHHDEAALLQVKRLHRSSWAPAIASAGIACPPLKSTTVTLAPARPQSTRRRSAAS